MIWDIHFADGTTLRVKHEKFQCACIIAQCQRVQYGETHDMELAVLRGTPRSAAASTEPSPRDAAADVVPSPEQEPNYAG